MTAKPATPAGEPILLREVADGVATLTLNRPSARNALSMELMTLLTEELEDIGEDKSIHVVVLAGAGPAFCAGHDLKEIRANPGREIYEALFQQCSKLMLTITKLPQPVIAKVHGIATAAGCQLVATCDLAIAADTTRFATPGVNIGLFCSTPMVALTRAVGRKHAMEMLLTGDMIGSWRRRDVRPDQPDRSGSGTGRDRPAIGGPYRVQVAADAGDRQGSLLPAARHGPGRGLRLCQRRHDPQYVGAGRGGRHRRLPGQAPPRMGRPLRREQAAMQHDTYTDSYLSEILASVKTIALVGASTNWNRPSYFVMKYLQSKGFRVIPVNPGVAGQELLGETVFARLEDIPDPVDMVDVFRNAEAAGPITDSAIAIHARIVWMQIGVRNDEAAARAEEAGLKVVMNRCPKIEYMRLHGEIGWNGINSNVITNRKRPVKAVKKLM